MNTAFSNAPKTVSAFRDRSVHELQLFYQKPIAKVSSELIITIMSVLFLAIFAIRPTLNTMSTLLKDIEDKTKVDQDLTKKAAALSTLNSDLVPLSSELTMLDKVIPNTPDLDGLLRRIEKLVSEKPLALTSLQTDTVPKELDPERTGTPQLSTLTIQLDLSGKYADIIAFLDQLTHMDREVKLSNLSISTQRNVASNNAGGGAASSSQELQMTVTVQAQYFGIPTEESAATQ